MAFISTTYIQYFDKNHIDRMFSKRYDSSSSPDILYFIIEPQGVKSFSFSIGYLKLRKLIIIMMDKIEMEEDGKSENEFIGDIISEILKKEKYHKCKFVLGIITTSVIPHRIRTDSIKSNKSILSMKEINKQGKKENGLRYSIEEVKKQAPILKKHLKNKNIHISKDFFTFINTTGHTKLLLDEFKEQMELFCYYEHRHDLKLMKSDLAISKNFIDDDSYILMIMYLNYWSRYFVCSLKEEYINFIIKRE